MKKFLAIIAILAVLFTIGAALMQAKDYEKYKACKAKCSFQFPAPADFDLYQQCMAICFDGIPVPD